MIRLHMLHHQGIQLPSPQNMGNVFKKHPVHGVIHRIKQYRLIVRQEVRVIGHALRHIVHPFKQSQPTVASTHPGQIVGDLSYTIHGQIPFRV